jgi:hypothetical protein
MFVAVDEVEDGRVYVAIERAEDPVANNFLGYGSKVTVEKHGEPL